MHLFYSCPVCISFFITINVVKFIYNSSRKHAYIILTSLNPTFIVKLGFTGVYIIFLMSAENINCGYSLEPPRRGGSNEYPQSMFSAEIWKLSEFFFYLKIFSFLVVTFLIYLNRSVFLMDKLKSNYSIWTCRFALVLYGIGTCMIYFNMFTDSLQSWNLVYDTCHDFAIYV